MELDELKKAWNTFDNQLQKESVADKEQIEKMIAAYKVDTRNSLKRLMGLNLTSLISGLVLLALTLMIWLLPSLFNIREEWKPRINSIVLFFGITMIAGLWWDYKTYRWTKGTNIEEMPVAVVSKRMNVLRRWSKYELAAIIVWALCFNVLNYWVMEYYKASAGVQALLIAFFVIFDAILIYVIYKKILYKHINNINKNLDDIEDICTE